MVLFPPERLGDGFHPVPWDASGAQRLGVDDTVLMARGPFVQTGPFMLQPLSGRDEVRNDVRTRHF